MSVLRVRGGARLRGRATPPADKSITHRALILGALAEGQARVRAREMGADNLATVEVLRALGVSLERTGDGVEIRGAGGPRGLRPSPAPLDCKNSGTTMRLMAGVLAGCPGAHVLVGDASLSRRPMRRLIGLERMGAGLAGQGERRRPPLTIRGAKLRGATHTLEIASAQVKSALLLAGLFADGATVVREPGPSRDHTERALAALGASIEVEGDTITVNPQRESWAGFEADVPPDASSAAFLLAAGAITGGEVEVETGLNPRRTGFVDALRALGISIVDAPGAPAAFGEPAGSLVARGRPTRPAEIRDPLSLRAIDELPLIACVAALAPGVTVIRDAAELRVKESDRIARTASLLARFGIRAEARPDGLDVHGGAPLRAGAQVDAASDHRIAMCGAVLGLAAPGETVVRGAEVLDVSFPGFADVLRAIGGRVEYEG